MGKLVFILGGARSGKSTFAIEQAKKLSVHNSRVVYVATARAIDKEMKIRIEKHKKRRPVSWKTVEESKDISRIVPELAKASVVIIDCLTILISNLLLAGESEKRILRKIEELLRGLKKRNLTTLVVSNEVGMGIVPENKLARSFRDIAGQINQVVARLANEVYIMEAGLPMRIK